MFSIQGPPSLSISYYEGLNEDMEEDIFDDDSNTDEDDDFEDYTEDLDDYSEDMDDEVHEDF